MERPTRRLARAVHDLLGSSYSHAKLEVQLGHVLVNGTVVADPGATLAPGDSVEHNPDLPRRVRPHRALPIEILHADADVLVVNKPGGLLVHPTAEGEDDTVLSRAAAELERRTGRHKRVHVVHRLDRDTSGVLVIAKRRSVAAKLGRAFQTRSVRKIYWALVKGVPKPPQGKVEAALVKAAGPEGDRVRKARPGEQDIAQSAVTHYAVVDRAGQQAAFVSLKPVTGRQHQLRAHMAIIGTPILGDEKYHGDRDVPEGVARKLHLHARRISFPHPSGEGVVDVTAPLPEHMRESFAAFGFDAREADTAGAD